MENAVNLALVEELGVLGLDTLELDGDLFASGHIGSEIDVSKAAGPNLATQAILLAHAQFHLDRLLQHWGLLSVCRGSVCGKTQRERNEDEQRSERSDSERSRREVKQQKRKEPGKDSGKEPGKRG